MTEPQERLWAIGAEERLRTIFDLSPDAIIAIDRQGVITDWNPAAEQIFGWARSEAVGQPVETIIPARHQQDHQRGLDTFRTTGRGRVLGKVLDHLSGLHREGYEFPVELTIAATGRAKKDTEFVTVVALVRDITARKRQLQLQETHFAVTRALSVSSSWEDASSRVLQQICGKLQWMVGEIWLVNDQDGALVLDHTLALDLDTRSASAHRPDQGQRAPRKPAPLAPGEGLAGRVWSTGEPAFVVDLVDAESFQRPALRKAGVHSAAAFPLVAGDRVLGVICLYRPDIRNVGSELLNVLADMGAQIGQFLRRHRIEDSLQDALRDEVEQRRLAQEQAIASLEKVAFLDEVTGLPNRYVFHDRMGQAARVAKREQTPLGLLVVDLDGFRHINETYGHQAGDLVLRSVGSRLSTLLRESDTVARLGDDEFGILLPGLANEKAAGKLAKRVSATIKRNVALNGKNTGVGASMGFALFPEHSPDVEELLHQAERAMERAMGTKRGWSIHQPVAQ